MKLRSIKHQTKQTGKHRIARNICFGALMLTSVHAVALSPIVVPPPAAYAQDDVIKPEWKQEHTSTWTSEFGTAPNNKTYKHSAYSHYDDNNNLVGTDTYASSSTSRTSHVKWIFYRSDQPNGIKKGTLILEPSDADGLMDIRRVPWKPSGGLAPDEEIHNTVKHIIIKPARIGNREVPVTFDNLADFNMLFNQTGHLETIDLRGLRFKYNKDTGFDYKNCSASLLFQNNFFLHTIILNSTITFDRATTFDAMFANCIRLRRILSEDDASKEMHYEANDPTCDVSGLANFDTQRATNMSTMFQLCWSITNFDFKHYPKFKTNKVTDFSYMFNAVNGWNNPPDQFIFENGNLSSTGKFVLKELDLSSFDTSSATNMIGMLYGQLGLEKLDISGAFKTDTQFKQKIYGGLHSLKHLTVNKNFKLSDTANLPDANGKIYRKFIKPFKHKNETAQYSGKWIVLKNNKPLPNVSFTTAELWNSDRFHKLLQQEAPGENDTLTLTWENKNDVSQVPTVTFMVENGVFEDEKFVHTVEVGADNKVETSAIPTKTKTGSAIKGWYKLGDASKTAVDCSTTTFQENTTLVAILDDAGTQGGGTSGSGTGTGGSGDSGGSGTGAGGTGGSGTGGSVGGGTNTNPSTPSNPETPRTFDTVTTRLAGDSAFDTMEHISKTAFPDHSKYAVLATSESYWDALSASSLAGTLDAPVLLSKPHELPEQTIRELKRLGVEKVYICGGEYALSSDIDAALQNMNIATERVSGAWASDTANEVARHVPDSDTAFLATSWGYEDALSAASYAYAHKTPLFLANYHTSALDADTLATMQEKGVKTVYIVGGYDVVSPDVEAQLAKAGIKAIRIGGKTAYDTSALLARKLIALGMHANNMALATGWGYTDALTGAALCGKNNAVLVLADDSNQTTVNGVVALYNDTIEHMYLLGGQKVVGDRVINVLKAVFNKVDEQEK